VLHHAVDVFALTVLVTTPVLDADMGSQVHAGGVEPAEKRLAGRVLAFDEVNGRI